jgi:hypothetical protein
VCPMWSPSRSLFRNDSEGVRKSGKVPLKVKRFCARRQAAARGGAVIQVERRSAARQRAAQGGERRAVRGATRRRRALAGVQDPPYGPGSARRDAEPPRWRERRVRRVDAANAPFATPHTGRTRPSPRGQPATKVPCVRPGSNRRRTDPTPKPPRRHERRLHRTRRRQRPFRDTTHSPSPRGGGTGSCRQTSPACDPDPTGDALKPPCRGKARSPHSTPPTRLRDRHTWRGRLAAEDPLREGRIRPAARRSAWQDG